MEELKNRKWLLTAPSDVGELFQALRYIQILPDAASVTLQTEYADSLRSLIEASFPSLNVVSVGEAILSNFDIQYDLARLAYLLKHQLNTNSSTFCFPYLKPTPSLPSSQVLNEDTLTIGLALYGGGEPLPTLEQLVSVMPLELRNNVQWVFFPMVQEGNSDVPRCFDYYEVANYITDYSGIAEWVQNVHLMIGFENDVTHLAGALAKKVWLLPSRQQDASSGCFSKSYPGADVWDTDTEHRRLLTTLESMFLYMTLRPGFNTFEPFYLDECHLPGEPIAGFSGFPRVFVHTTSRLQTFWDLQITDVNSVSIETTTICNLRCNYCPHSTDQAKPAANMSDETFYRIIDSLKEYLPEYKGEIIPSLYGEPLLDARLDRFITYIRGKFPLATINLFSNGHFFTFDRYCSLLEAGVTTFKISLHQETLLDVTAQTLERIKERFGNINNIDIIPIYYSNNYFNRGGLVKGTPPSQEVSKKMLRCASGFNNLVFDWQGQAILCCNDYSSRHQFGSINKQSVQEIWEGQGYNQVKNHLLTGYLPLKTCRTCMMHDGVA